MSATDNISNNLIRDGISQLQRKMDALGTEKVQVDERSTEQLLGFLYRYARYVLYYDDTDQPNGKADMMLASNGDWQDFFRNNPPFQYAAIQQMDTAAFDAAYTAARTSLTHQQPADQFWSIFFRILDMVMQLNSWVTQLDNTTGLSVVLTALVQSDFSKALYRLIAIANTMVDADNPLPDEAVNSIAILRSNPGWALTMDKLIAKDAYLVRLNDYPRRKRDKMLTQLDDLFNIFYKGIQQVQDFALQDFEVVLKGEQKHQPHVGLLYAFLQLFGQVKTQMNTISRQHLNFFYEQVLQLKKKPLTPDHVHVVAELAKQLPDYLLKKDTALKAGKDATGKDVVFDTEEDVVLNKAKVSELRTLFKDGTANLYAAPVAASADGLGEGFRNPAFNSWPLLGTASYVSKNNTQSAATHFPFAATGLLLSSPVLLLREGTRNVTVTIQLNGLGDKGPQLAALLTKPFYLLNAEVLTAFEKSGIDKVIVAAIRTKLSGAEKWLDDSDFVTYTDISTQVDLAKGIALRRLLQVDCTTEGGWYAAPKLAIALNSNNLDLTFELAADAPALVAAAPDVLKATYPVKDPLLRVLFNHSLHYSLAEKEVAWYDTLSNLVIVNATIKVDVKNVRKLLLGNDEGPLDPNNKFLPFTGVPKVGSNFYIGSDEVFRKKLAHLELKAEWEGLPDKFDDIYSAYNAGVNNAYFTASMERLNNGVWDDIPGTEKRRLFDDDSSLNLASVKEIDVPDTGSIPLLTQSAPLIAYNNASLYGFVRIKLDKSFLHDRYPSVLASQLIKISNLKLSDLQVKANKVAVDATATKGKTGETSAMADAFSTNAPDDPDAAFDELSVVASNANSSAAATLTDANDINAYVNGSAGNVIGVPLPPYTPTIKTLSLEYKAEATGAEITLLHKYPFEEGNYKSLSSATTFMPVVNEEGTLYIGLEQAVPGTNITLLFQLSEFTADPDMRRAGIQWHYLVGNEWKTLEKNTQVLSDTTNEMLVSGIVTIALPWDADTTHTMLPAGFHWLRVSTEKYSAAVCEAVAVLAQASRAVFLNQDNDPARVGVALPGQTISSLVVPDAMINKLSQPFPSFGGRKEETEGEFHTRISERLRHKGRAINVFDYERIVLDAFPEIFKIKCIPHSKMCRSETGEITQLGSPGWVTLAVIPRIDDYPSDERFNPKVSRITLENVSLYLDSRTTVFANVQVINPVYQPISFKGNIRLKDGKDENYYLKKLVKEVQAYLSPWINTGSQDIVFGGTLMMSSVLQFIEQRDYVDYVTDFIMYVTRNGVDGPPVKAVTADTPWSVLTAGEQLYTIINNTSCSGAGQQPVFRIK
ncbi:Baseplate J-like protein [Chitinophaga sp. CF118]|uniref:baseplate J/gp47 family protein n=1 Tax=Chitinophaga sp. CF118 TaxID=1884367 RepID=UPI0008F3D7E5|nr:baseplate J/gp47 family protein [Chitinophaga sp. CF118]SFD73861.1 Baseplate J-like protein [Chitinophaga sp. CF118]